MQSIPRNGEHRLLTILVAAWCDSRVGGLSPTFDLHRYRFSAFWLRSKCSICSYQLNIWYVLHRRTTILNWFLELGEVSGACSAFATGWPGIAVPPGPAHSPRGIIITIIKCKKNSYWVCQLQRHCKDFAKNLMQVEWDSNPEPHRTPDAFMYMFVILLMSICLLNSCLQRKQPTVKVCICMYLHVNEIFMH